MPAPRRLDAAAPDDLVASRAAGESWRSIAARLGVAHTTLTRYVDGGPDLQRRISAATAELRRRERDQARRESRKLRQALGVQPGSRPEHEWNPISKPEDRPPSDDPEADEAIERAREAVRRAAHSSKENVLGRPVPGPRRRRAPQVSFIAVGPDRRFPERGDPSPDGGLDAAPAWWLREREGRVTFTDGAGRTVHVPADEVLEYEAQGWRRA